MNEAKMITKEELKDFEDKIMFRMVVMIVISTFIIAILLQYN